jgi:hypothetical protein
MSLNGKIDNLSNLVVSKYTEEGVPLNETISKIAESEHFNENHIARLVEMSNKKTFLRVFPEKHSFDVASVPAVMETLNRQKEAKDKDKAGGNAKAASESFLPNETNYKLLTLFKPEGNTKEAEDGKTHSVSLKQQLSSLQASQTKRAIEELSFASRQKRAEMLDCEDKLVDITKQAMLRGSTFADLETYTLSTLDGKQKKASEVLNRVYDRIKNMPFVEKRASERGRRVEPFVGESNIYTDMVEKIIKNAEDIPAIERGINILKKKLEV